MKKALVGYTGFVGSSLMASGFFNGLYNSKNIRTAYGTKPELLVYAGVPAEKFVANTNPEQDFKIIQTALENIRAIAPERLILISTIDVYKTAEKVDENTRISDDGIKNYGLNRYYLEEQARALYPDVLIIRLPALFGKGLKKNFIYDYINRIPVMLTPVKYEELLYSIPELKQFYYLEQNGFYQCSALSNCQKSTLKKSLTDAGFTSLNFTDSRSSFQFYNLNYLWTDICKAMELRLSLLNLSTEPLIAAELYKYLSGEEFLNHRDGSYAKYDFRSIHYEQMGGTAGYLYSAEQIKKEIKSFVKGEEQPY